MSTSVASNSVVTAIVAGDSRALSTATIDATLIAEIASHWKCIFRGVSREDDKAHEVPPGRHVKKELYLRSQVLVRR
jgi:hypothetical protein